jgi:serine/threonine protein kinase
MGQCVEGEEHLLLTEFAALGSLSDAFDTWEDTITLDHNLVILQQIAQGMEHLISNGIVHRDLAARNVLVFVFDPKVVSATLVKVTDYGLSTNMYNRSHVTLRQGEMYMGCGDKDAADACIFLLPCTSPSLCKSALAFVSSQETNVHWYASLDSHTYTLWLSSRTAVPLHVGRGHPKGKIWGGQRCVGLRCPRLGGADAG